MTLGADPLVVSTIVTSAQYLQTRGRQDQDLPRDEDADPATLQGFLVRKEEKTHGTGRRIEGFCQRGASVVIVDDVCTTGQSTIGAIEAARDAGMEVVGVICLVERTEAGGRSAVEQAAAPAPFISVFSAREIREVHLSAVAARADG
jgi:orotate phosphoribosyltransferase